MEKASYRQNLGLIQEMFPHRVALSVTECASLLGCSVQTIRAYTPRAIKPLPSIKSEGNKIIIPVVPLANWLS